MRLRNVLLPSLAALAITATTYATAEAPSHASRDSRLAPMLSAEQETAAGAVVVRQWNEGVWWTEIGRQWLAAQADLDRRVASPTRESRVGIPDSSGGGEVGECTGFVIPDWIIQRESHGSSTAHNPSGAHGCAQTLLSHYSGGGACAGDDPYTIQGQRDCVYTLSDGGSNLAPWAG